MNIIRAPTKRWLLLVKRNVLLLVGLLSSNFPLVADGVIDNDTAWRDTAGNEIWCNGGHIIREGGVFYWLGYDTGPGRWPWRINLCSSRSLADWKFENIVIGRASARSNAFDLATAWQDAILRSSRLKICATG